MADQPIGPILDGLGLTIELGDGDLVDSAVVIIKTVLANGEVGIDICNSSGMDWLGQLALITAASRVVNENPFDARDG